MTDKEIDNLLRRVAAINYLESLLWKLGIKESRPVWTAMIEREIIG